MRGHLWQFFAKVATTPHVPASAVATKNNKIN
jgi:hypothetical protein